jgi:hypothetical protein
MKPLLEKTCPSCGVLKPRSDYYKKGTSIQTVCKPCWREQRKVDRLRYPENRDHAHLLEWRRQNYIKNPEPAREAAKRHYAKMGGYGGIIARPGEKPRRWDASAARRSREKRASLGGAYADETRRKYAACPPGHHIDHIIPLRGKNVSGLHVPWNLEPISAEENLRKGNRLDSEVSAR